MLFAATSSVSNRATFAAVVFVWLVGTRVNASAGEPPPARRWTDAASGRTIEAEFLGLTDGKIRLRTSDGKVWELLPERLIQADRDFVQQATAAEQLARLKVFKDKRTGQSVTGCVVRGENSDGHIRLLVRTEDGQEIWLFSAQCEITDAGQSSSDGASSGALGHPPARATSSGDHATRTVVVEGVGLTPEEALKDAFRAAVRQVVGEVVDAETLVKDDQIVKDQILTYSDGFVPQHTKLSEKNEGELFRVTIRAVVERRKLEVRLRAANVSLKNVDGQSLFGNIVSQLENEKDAAALLRAALEGFPKNCLEANSTAQQN